MNRPNSSYLSELEPFSEQLGKEPVELIFLFATSLEAFKQEIHTIVNGNYLAVNGLLYVAYPKKGNSVYPAFVHRDKLFPELGVSEETGYIKNTSFKFNRMVSLDEIFTVVGIKNSPKRAAKIKSIDYE